MCTNNSNQTRLGRRTERRKIQSFFRCIPDERGRFLTPELADWNDCQSDQQNTIPHNPHTAWCWISNYWIISVINKIQTEKKWYPLSFKHPWFLYLINFSAGQKKKQGRTTTGNKSYCSASHTLLPNQRTPKRKPLFRNSIKISPQMNLDLLCWPVTPSLQLWTDDKSGTSHVSSRVPSYTIPALAGCPPVPQLSFQNHPNPTPQWAKQAESFRHSNNYSAQLNWLKRIYIYKKRREKIRLPD